MLIEFTDEQTEAINMALESKVFVLTGGPGTGKTTTCKEIIRRAEDRGLTLALCAPSGKAAKRMTEATGHVAYTIHKLLGATPSDTGRFLFACDEDHPLREDIIIVDEVSMVSTDLMASLLRAIPVGTKLILVGDQDQLPSVGPGTVLKDILACRKFKHVELTKIHRNAGDIVRACHNIKRGKGFTPYPVINLEQGHNYKHIENYDAEVCANTIVELVAQKLPKLGYDPLWDIQVISPYRGDQKEIVLSCDDLNKRLQQALNLREPVSDKYVFKVGDKAIQTRNQKVALYNGTIGFEGELYTSSAEKSYVVNGDICQIINITSTQLIARFFYPDRIVILPRVDNHLLLAYAITCHRFQGSEAPVIVIPILKSFTRFVNRPWIYTAISRAQTLCITVGQMNAIEVAARRKDSEVRITHLLNKLKGDGNGKTMGNIDEFGFI